MMFESTFLRWVTSAIVFSSAIAGISYTVAWRQIISKVNDRDHQELTLDSLHRMQNAIEDYRQKLGHPPESLSDLPQLTLEDAVLHSENTTESQDFWRHTIEYEKEHVRVVSRGKDGEPGGTGFNSDIFSTDQTLPMFPFRDFIFAREGRAALGIALQVAAIALITFLIVVRPNDLATKRGFPWVRVIALSIASIVVAGLITTIQLSAHH